MPNFMLPGNPRYQPKSLMDFFGYDNLAHSLVEVELAGIGALYNFGKISDAERALLTREIQEKLFRITMTEVDKIEREITTHDIRALVRIMQEILPPELRRFVHMLFTSYDVIDTARVLSFKRAHTKVVQPLMRAFIKVLSAKAAELADVRQIGRTHGQHALPTTAGFWLATILSRVVSNARQMDVNAYRLVGKISGAVGAYNAQVGLGCYQHPYRGDHHTFETEVLSQLGLRPARISTQILPPEPLAYYLFSATMQTGALAQLGRDCRNLMRTEIGEIREPFEKGQVGSSTMAHKRNPITFENTEGQYFRTKNEFGKLMDTLVSEHQRDLVGSCVARDFPAIIVNLTYQLESLMRPGKEDSRPFIERSTVDKIALNRNLALLGDVILAEPWYLALQMAGYPGDAHKVVNEQAVPLVSSECSLATAIGTLTKSDAALDAAYRKIPRATLAMLQDPKNYIGTAAEKTREVCADANDYLKGHN